MVADKPLKKAQNKPYSPVFQLSRRPSTQYLPQYETDIECADVDQQTLQDVVMSAQGRAPHSTRLVTVGKAAFDEFSSPSELLFAIVSSNSAVVSLNSLLLSLLTIPVPLASLLTFRNVTGNFILSDPLDDRAAVIALIRYQLFDPVHVDLRLLLGMQLDFPLH